MLEERFPANTACTHLQRGETRGTNNFCVLQTEEIVVYPETVIICVNTWSVWCLDLSDPSAPLVAWVRPADATATFCFPGSENYKADV